MADDYLKKVLKFDPKPLHKRVIDAIGVLSKFTHAGGGELIDDQKKIDKFAKDAVDALALFQTTIRECRDRVSEAVERHLDAQVLDRLIAEAIDEIDVLATHYYFDGHGIEDIATIIDDAELHFEVSGYVSVTLQWGSDGDYRRGDGLRGGGSFPFTCMFTAPVDDPKDVQMENDSFSVDTVEFEFPGSLRRLRA
jgi:hypothetical protein